MKYIGAVHKRHPQSGGLSSADIFWMEKTSDFLKIVVCPNR